MTSAAAMNSATPDTLTLSNAALVYRTKSGEVEALRGIRSSKWRGVAVQISASKNRDASRAAERRPTVLIAGARTGLGHEFAVQYAAAEWEVISPTCADMDVTQRSAVDAYAAGLQGRAVDLLINNAGLRTRDVAASRLGGFTLEAWLPSLAANVVGTCARQPGALPNLTKGAQKKAVTTSVSDIDSKN